MTGLRIGGRTFSGLGIRRQTVGSSVRTIFQSSFTEEVMGARKSIFEGVFKFSASWGKKKLNRTDAADRGDIG